jgi:integrase
MRDTAIIRLLLDSGGRLGEISALTVEDIDFDMDVAHAVGRDAAHILTVSLGSSAAYIHDHRPWWTSCRVGWCPTSCGR